MITTIADPITLSRRELQTLFYVGRKLTLVSNAVTIRGNLGNTTIPASEQSRTVKAHKSYGYQMLREDGRVSDLRFEAGDRIEMHDGRVTIYGREGQIQAQYLL